MSLYIGLLYLFRNIMAADAGNREAWEGKLKQALGLQVYVYISITIGFM